MESLLYKIMYIAILSILLARSCRPEVNSAEENRKRKPPGIDNEDAYLNVVELIQKYGYGVEGHKVTTQDGCVLELHRITARPKHIEGSETRRKPPVLLVHGMLSSSADWIIAGPGQGLGYLLADQGFDVWLGNTRGTRYSRQHETLNSASSRYWDHSLHEIGLHDVPAMVDHILEVTSRDPTAGLGLRYLGHGQGGASLAVTCSLRPEYNDRIRQAVLLEPVVFLNHTRSPLLEVISQFDGDTEVLRKNLGGNELKPNLTALGFNIEDFCKSYNVSSELCGNTLLLLSGPNTPELLEERLLQILPKHYPAGGSTKQLLHYLQILKSGKFQRYHYGYFKNLFLYRHIRAPEYPLDKVTVPISVYFSGGDLLSASSDVKSFYELLPGRVALHEIPAPRYAHLDPLWAPDAPDIIYQRIIEDLKK